MPASLSLSQLPPKALRILPVIPVPPVLPVFNVLLFPPRSPRALRFLAPPRSPELIRARRPPLADSPGAILESNRSSGLYVLAPPSLARTSVSPVAPQFARALLLRPPARAARAMSSVGAAFAPEGRQGGGEARAGGGAAAAVTVPGAGAAVAAPALVPPARVALEGVAERYGEIIATVRIDTLGGGEGGGRGEHGQDGEQGEGGEREPRAGGRAEGQEREQVQRSRVVLVKAGGGVTRKELEAAVLSSPFVAWLQQMVASNGLLGTQGGCDGAKCALNGVTVQSVDMFGSSKVGFVKFKADVTDVATGAQLPGIVFARGPAVGILMLLRAAQGGGGGDSGGDSSVSYTDYVVLTEQARVPVGRVLLEMPAGMLDGNDGEFVGTAAKEVKEETGITVVKDHLINLTAFLDPSTGQQMLPSPGGCDEGILLFLYRATVSQARIAKLQGRETGLRHEGELIKVHVRPLKGIWRHSPDCKVLAALALYENALKEGLLEDEFPALEEEGGGSSDGD